MNNDSSDVLRDLIENAPPRITSAAQPGFGPKPHSKSKRRLVGAEYDEVFTNYWYRRSELAPDREQFVTAAMDWVVYAILFASDNHGEGRNHEIRATSTTIGLGTILFASADRMVRNSRCKIRMQPVCWWDVQEHYHNIERNDIHMLAEDLQGPLVSEAIERLKAAGFIYWHSGVWTLSTNKSRPYILRLKRQKRIFLAPEPSKRCGEYFVA